MQESFQERRCSRSIGLVALIQSWTVQVKKNVSGYLQLWRPLLYEAARKCKSTFAQCSWSTLPGVPPWPSPASAADSESRRRGSTRASGVAVYYPSLYENLWQTPPAHCMDSRTHIRIKFCAAMRRGRFLAEGLWVGVGHGTDP